MSVNVVGSVTAELLLDTKNFTSGLKSAMSLVEELNTNFETFDITKTTEQITNLETMLKEQGETITNHESTIRELESVIESLDSVLDNNIVTFNKTGEAVKETQADLEHFASVNEKINASMKTWSFSAESLGYDRVNSQLTNLANNYVATTNQMKKLSSEFVTLGKGVNSFTTSLSPMVTELINSNEEFERSKSELLNISASITQTMDGYDKFKANLGSIRSEVEAFVASQQELSNSSQHTASVFSAESLGYDRVNTKLTKLTNNYNSLNNASKRWRDGLASTSTNLNQYYSNVEKATIATKQWEEQQIINNNSLRTLGTTLLNDIPMLERYREQLQEISIANESASTSIKKLGTSSQSAQKGMNNLITTTNKLSNAMTSLKMIGTAVSSMFIWTFGMSLWEATKQTVESKNEMESYFTQMGMSEKSISTFNKGLDETVKKFSKLNKFMIGETIASIGMEFDLTAKQMKSSMDVVAMIQNEYVRAGRKESEANLAVKDILQGEFLRLSRETGVGKQDLIDTGVWDGNLKDIEGLMDALRIVGEDRHWDLFASKCTSLNDVISTTRNRISEFTATLIDDLSPVIVDVFNHIIETVDGVTSAWENFNPATKVTASIGSFVLLSTTLMVLSGKVGLAEIAMYGYGNSLMATILKMDVATVKEYGHLNAIIAKITGYEAETVASMGNLKALSARILGVNSSVVAENGLKTALVASALAQRTNTAVTTANTAAEKVNLVTKDGVIVKTNAYTTAKDLESMAESENTTTKEYGALMNESLALSEIEASVASSENTSVTEANTLAKIMNGEASIGLLGTLVLLTTEMDISTVATMSATEALWAFITSATVASALTVGAVLIGIGVAMATLGAEVWDTTSKMKEFNNIVDNGEEILQSYYDTAYYFEQQEKSLREQLNNTTQGTKEYNLILADLEVASRNAEQAQKDLKTAIDAVNQAQGMKNWVDEELPRKTTEKNAVLNEQMKKQGYSEKQIGSTSRLSAMAQFGSEKEYRALQVNVKQMDDFNQAEIELHNNLKRNKVPQQERLQWIQDLSQAYGDLEEHSRIANTTDDGMEWAFNSLYAGMDQMKIDWIKFWSNPDFASALQGFSKLLPDVIGNPLEDFFGMFTTDNILKYIIDGVKFGEIIKGSIGKIFNFDEWFGDIDIVGGITDLFNNLEIPDIPKMFFDAITGKDKTGKGPGVAKKIDVSGLLGAIGIDTEGITEWVEDNIIRPFTEPITSFLSDPLGSLEDFTFSGVDFIRGLLGMGDDTDDSMAVDTVKSWMDESIFQPIGDTWNEFVSDPLGFIEANLFDGGSVIDGLLGDVTHESVMSIVDSSIIQPFGNAIQTGLANIPIVGDVLSMLGLIDGANDTAKGKGTDIGTAFGDAVEDYIRNIPIVGDILSFLGVIDSTAPTAKNKGNTVGSNVKTGVDTGKQGTADLVKDEMGEIITAMSKKVSSVYATAQQIGSSIIGGINSIIQHHSPGVPALLIYDEMTEIQHSMDSQRDNIYSSAQSISQAITEGITPNTDINLNGDALSQYRTDSITAMNLTDNTVANAESSFNTLDVNTGITFGNIGDTISNTMGNIAGTTKTNYNTIVATTKSQLGNMQSETTKNINQIKTSWNGMQTALIQSAENIRSETGQKIHSLQNNMATFWRKVQNPALLLGGAGSPAEEKGGARPRRFGSIGGRVRKALTPKGVAGNPNIGAKATGISSMFTPKGNTSIKMLDALDMIYEAMIDDKPHYFGGWDFNWSKDIKDALLKWHTHFGQIYDPYLSVGKFENDNFPVRGIAEIARNYIYDAIGRTSYEFYYDSKYGSPLASWNAGHFNCYDGALLVMALARAFGFPNSTMVHGSWNGIPHVWARIAGLGDIDATAIQGGYGFTAPSRTGSAGGLIQRFKHNKEPSTKSEGNTINGDVIININGDGDNPKDIAKEVRNVIIDLFNPNPAKGY